MSLFSRASQPNPAYQQALQHLLTAASGLQHKVEHELPVLLAEKSTDVEYFTPALTELQQALTAVKQHIKNPMLVGKTIVAFGGAFSAGKSSLINALIGEKRLQTQIDPTTSVPTYVCAGEAEAIYATNLFEQQIELSAAEFAQITHDEQNNDTCISGLLSSITLQTSKFAWQNLAVLDTPGYSKPVQGSEGERTDAQIAREQLNAADVIVWVVSAEAGGISEDELAFLKQLKADTPKLLVISRADRKTVQDLCDIENLTKNQLLNKGIVFCEFFHTSSRKLDNFDFRGLRFFLDKIDISSRVAHKEYVFDFLDEVSFFKKNIADNKSVFSALDELSVSINKINFFIEEMADLEKNKQSDLWFDALYRLDAYCFLPGLALILRHCELSQQQINSYLKSTDRNYVFGHIEKNVNINWSIELIEAFKDEWKWDVLSNNKSLPWSNNFIDRFKDKWDWGCISCNDSICWSLENLSVFFDRVVFDRILDNQSVCISAEIILLFSNKMDWKKLSGSIYVDWSFDLLKRFEDCLDFGIISKNASVPWSLEIIHYFSEKIDWKELSLNSGFPWSVWLINENKSKVDWGCLSGNKSLPWSLLFFEEFKDYWDWDRLSGNESVPWSLKLIEEFHDKWSWSQFSGNKSLPWSLDFIKKFEDKLDWSQLSRNESLPWSMALIEDYKDRWDWTYLSQNKKLPWSQYMLEKFEKKWDWDGMYGLSANTSIPFSIDLIDQFKHRWNWGGIWGEIHRNPSIPWSAELFFKFRQEWSFAIFSDCGDVIFPALNQNQIDLFFKKFLN